MSDDICVNIFSGINGLFSALGNAIYQNNDTSNPQNALQNLFLALFLMAAIVLAVIQQNQRHKLNQDQKIQLDSDRLNRN